jgi:rRNA maturation endonuclease Nob1
MANDLPIYKITIDEEYSEGNALGIEQVAFTAKPAIMVKGMAFSSTQSFEFKDEPKMRIVAPAMIPMDIYRNDDGEEYYVQFTEAEIENIFSDFMQNLNNKDLFNLEHDAGETVPAYILEAWLVENPKVDKAFTSYGIEVPKGTLMLTAQVTDSKYYEQLVKKGQVGFSIEGFLGLKLSELKTKYSMKLPDGEHLIEGKIYIVTDGEIVEVKDAPVEEAMSTEEAVVEEEVTMATDTEEEVVTDEEVVEEEVAMAVDATADAEAVLAIVTPILDERINEVLQLIAELKNMMPIVEEVEVEEEIAMRKLSVNERFTAFRETFKK